MESIEQMIKRLCPKGVEYVKLGEVASIKNGRDHKKYEDGDVPVYGSGGVMRHIDTFIYNQPSVLLPRKGSLGNVLFVDEPFWTVDTMFWTVIDSRRVNEKFLFYYLKNYHIEKLSLTNGGAVPSLTQSQLNDILVPLPPMEVQNRIVEILDKMTTLTAELEAELEARKQQYEYYRNKLLTFNEIVGGNKQVTWKKISEIGTVVRGKRLTKKMLSEENIYPVYHGGLSPIGKFSKKNRNANTVMIINVGASAGTVGFCETDFWSSDGCFCLDINSFVMNKYVYHALVIKQHLIQSRVRKAGIPTLDASVIEDIVIPVPPLSEQQRIVSILDRFEALTTDLQSGLPAEIEARRQQYEYYRNKLLTFEAV